MNKLNEKDECPVYFLVNEIIIVTSNEKMRNVICETVLREFRISKGICAFILTNLIVLY